MNYSQIKKAFQGSQLDSKYKRCGRYIVQLFPTSETKTNENRTNVKNHMFAKFRGSQFQCGKILDTKRKCFVVQIKHKWHSTEITYKTGEVVIPDGWTADIDEVCGHGIHFFNSLVAAYLYEFGYVLNVHNHDCGDVRMKYIPHTTLYDYCDDFQAVMADVQELQK